MRLLTGLACAAAAVAIGACGNDDKSSTEGGAERIETTTTRVEVVEQQGDSGFDGRTIFDRDGPGVVTVIATGLDGVRGGGGGLGSGFVLNGDGDIATNAHVVTSGEAQNIKTAGKVYVRFGDGNQVSARIRGFDPFSDVALLRIEPKGLTLRPLPLANVEDIKIGEPVAAIGSPFGEERSLSVGVVSATDRSISSLTGFETNGAIQTDAAINSGNSGGPLINAKGEVLGINSQIRTTSGEGSGVGFAVPVDVVERSLDQLRRTGKVRYAYLGVSTRGIYPQLASRFGLPVRKGAWVQEVVDGGPADDAGLRAGDKKDRFQEAPYQVGGDIITKVGDQPIDADTDLGRFLLKFDPGDTVELEVYRGDEKRTVKVKVGERPLSAPRRG